jgi:uncharacterized protein (TIGR03083 family)
MSEWNAMTYDAKDNLLRVVRREAEGMFALAEPSEAWERETACTGWQVRDVVAHLVDTTEAYFEAFDAARSKSDVPPPYGLPGMATRANERAQSFRDVPQEELLDRARTDFDKMMGMFEALGPDEWGGLTVPHFYMGPLPAFFYPVFQLMDYGVHSWDIRQGSGKAHGLAGDTADLLVPFMFILWQATTRVESGSEPMGIGIRIVSGENAGDYRVQVDAEGLAYEQAHVGALPAAVEFDPGSFVLTTFGRSNSGTIRGDVPMATRYLNTFFRI